MTIESPENGTKDEGRSQDTCWDRRTDSEHDQDELEDHVDEEVEAGQRVTPQVAICKVLRIQNLPSFWPRSLMVNI